VGPAHAHHSYAQYDRCTSVARALKAGDHVVVVGNATGSLGAEGSLSYSKWTYEPSI